MLDVWSSLRARACRAISTAHAWLAAIDRFYLENARELVASPQARETIRALNARGVAQACVSNSSRLVVDANIAALGVGGLIAFSISLDDVAAGKPDPEPYLQAMRRLGLSGAEALAVEDSVAGAASAQAAGLFVVRYDPVGRARRPRRSRGSATSARFCGYSNAASARASLVTGSKKSSRLASSETPTGAPARNPRPACTFAFRRRATRECRFPRDPRRDQAVRRRARDRRLCSMFGAEILLKRNDARRVALPRLGQGDRLGAHADDDFPIDVARAGRPFRRAAQSRAQKFQHSRRRRLRAARRPAG